jgi:hypothetical protein
MRLGDKKAEMALLLLPVVVLVGVGVTLFDRDGTHLVLPDHRFHITVNRIEVKDTRESRNSSGGIRRLGKRARAIRKDEVLLRLYVFVDYTGAAPKWWLDDNFGAAPGQRVFSRPAMDLTDAVFIDKHQRQVSYPCFYNGNGTDSQRRYVIHADCYVPRLVSLQGSTFVATAWVAGAGKVRFLAPITRVKYQDFRNQCCGFALTG